MSTLPQPTPPRAGQALGIALALLGMLMFALNDVLGKWLVSSYSIAQLLLLRSASALLLLAPLVWHSRAAILRPERPGLQTGRVLASSFEVWCFYFAVATLPLADVMTYWLATPIYVAALSPWLLGERVGPWRWGAIAMGFVGVVIALRPGSIAFTPALAASLVGSLAFAYMILSARMLRATPDAALVFWQTLGAAVTGILLAPFFWVDPSLRDLALLALLGVVATVAHLLIARALKLADASNVAPVQYTLMLWAVLFGWLVFGEVPQAAVLAGAAIIVASGLMIWLRETRARRAFVRPGEPGPNLIP